MRKDTVGKEGALSSAHIWGTGEYKDEDSPESLLSGKMEKGLQSTERMREQVQEQLNASMDHKGTEPQWFIQVF